MTIHHVPTGALLILTSVLRDYIAKKEVQKLATERAQVAYGEQVTEPLSFEFKPTLGASERNLARIHCFSRSTLNKRGESRLILTVTTVSGEILSQPR